jgi:GNAT superfamily N-acetyltransferase
LKRSDQTEQSALANGAQTTNHQPLATHHCCGHEVKIRFIGHEGDAERLNRYFSGLSRDSARSRLSVLGVPQAARHQYHSSTDRQMLCERTEATAENHRHSCECTNEVTLVAVVENAAGEQQIVGEASYVVDLSCAGQAEAAVSVADAYQAQGLGRTLIRSLIEAARAKGITRLAVYVFADNYPALRTFMGLGFRVVLWQPGVLKMVLELPDDYLAQEIISGKNASSASRVSSTLGQTSRIMPEGHVSAVPVSHGASGKSR